MSVPSESSKSATIKVRFPLSLRILIAVTLAVIVGSVCGPLGDLGELGLLVIRLLKAVAAPLIFLSIIEALVIAEIAGRDAIRLLTLSAVNAVVAVAIGLGMAHLVHGGERWRHHLDQLLTSVGTGAAASRPVEALGFSATLSRYIPDNLLDPILKNNIISLVLLAVAIGVALRQQQSTPAGRALLTLTQGALAVTRTLMEWLIVIIPFAVFAVVTSAVGKSGALLFSLLGIFVLTVVSGMALQTGVYYAALVRWAGGLSLRRFYSAASAPFMMALSTGSSVASVRVTLKSLDEDLKVSPRASRLSALVGTNLNHAGIILYEAVTAIFVAQAFGLHLDLGQQIAIALASVLAGIGIAGIPDAGLMTLPLVLAALHLPDAAVASVIPLVLSVDWLLGRCRAATNVLSDMTVAVVLDRWQKRETNLSRD